MDIKGNFHGNGFRVRERIERGRRRGDELIDQEEIEGRIERWPEK